MMLAGVGSMSIGDPSIMHYGGIFEGNMERNKMI